MAMVGAYSNVSRESYDHSLLTLKLGKLEDSRLKLVSTFLP